MVVILKFKLLGDKFGNYVHLGERECSVQRNNQKLIEECPSSFVDPEFKASPYFKVY